MKIIRTSPLTGQVNVRNIDITLIQYREWLRGAFIQDIMPDISVDDREFIMTGMTPEDWATLFGGES